MNKRTGQLIQRKLNRLQSYVDELSPYLDSLVETYLATPGQRRIVERLAQVIIESSIDINSLLLSSVGQSVPDTARESFSRVHHLGIIDDYLLTRFRRTYIGFRNRIVHDYDMLDNQIVYHTARRLLEDARRYVAAITRYLAATEAEAEGKD